MYLKDIEFFLTDDKKHILDVRTGELFELDENIDFLEIYTKRTFNNELEKDIYNFIQKNEQRKKNNILTPNVEELDTIRINVANACNLACKYCYANEGDYGNATKLLDLKNATQIANFIKNNFPSVKTLFFFGGEPLLNIAIIEYFCEQFPEKDFSLITNGTIINEKIIYVIKKYNIKLAVSIDGPRELHDAYRVTKKSAPTYDTIFENIKLFFENGIEFTAIQATFTKLAAEKTSWKNLIAFFDEHFNFKHLTIGCDTNYEELSVVENEEVTIKYLNKQKMISGLTNNALLSVKANLPLEVRCGASNYMILIDHNGDIFPCQRFIGDMDAKNGNIHSFKLEEFNHSRKKFNQKFLEKTKCYDCVGRYICNVCIKETPNISEKNCEEIRKKCHTIYNNIPLYLKDSILMKNFDFIFQDENQVV